MLHRQGLKIDRIISFHDRKPTFYSDEDFKVELHVSRKTNTFKTWIIQIMPIFHLRKLLN